MLSHFLSKLALTETAQVEAIRVDFRVNLPPSGDRLELEEGQRFTFHIANHSAQPVFFWVFDLGLSIEDSHREGELLEFGYLLPSASVDYAGWRLALPEALPLPASGPASGQALASEFKLLAADIPIDWQALALASGDVQALAQRHSPKHRFRDRALMRSL